MTKPPDDPHLRHMQTTPIDMSSRAGWFIAGGVAVLVLVGLWLVSGGVFDNPPTAGIIAPALPPVTGE